MPKKFDTAVVATIRRRYGLPKTHASPSRIERTSGSCDPFGATTSVSRVRSRAISDRTYVTAVARMANGAVMSPMSQPPAAGPAIPASSCVACSLPFASAIWSSRTSEGMMLWYDTSKNTVATPITSATTTMCQISSAPAHHSSGRAARATARTRSAQIMT